MNTDADRDVSRLYRAGASEEPPSWLDSAILTAAERDLVQPAMRASPGWRWRWQAPLAVAAVLTLAVSLALVVEGELEQTPASSPPLPAPVAPSPSASSERADAQSSQFPNTSVGRDRGLDEHERLPAAKAAPRAPQKTESFRMQRTLPETLERSAREVLEKERERADAPAPPLASAPSVSSSTDPLPLPREQRAEPAAESGMGPPPSDGGTGASKPAQSDSGANFGERRMHSTTPAAKREHPPVGDERSKLPAAPQAGASPTAPPPAQGPARQRIEPSEAQRDALMTPEQWLREIEQLRRDGREDRARARLDQFRKRFPDHPLPESWK
ncbi:MAG: hypothetical protein ACREUX_10190 [Burkholderiales bacterium]